YNTGGRKAAFHIVAWYFAVPPACFDPALTWPWWLPALSAPTGWQFCGTHQELGLSVDRGWYDDWFGSVFSGAPTGGSSVTGQEKLAFVRLAYSAFLWRVPSPSEHTGWAAQIADDGSNLDPIMAAIEDAPEADAIKALRVKLLAGGAVGPQGPAGPPGAPGG